MSEKTSPWSGLAIGLVAVSVIGLIYLVWRKKPEVPALAGLEAEQPLELDFHFEALRPMLKSMPMSYDPDLIRTYNLTTQAMLIASGTDVAYRVKVRNVGPPGTFAFVGFSPRDLQGAVGTIPDRVYPIPSGESEVIKVRAGESLYARGNLGGTLLAVNASRWEEAAS